MDEVKRVVEAALFMSAKPLSLTDLYNMAKGDVSELRSALNDLIQDYSDRDGALEIMESAAGYQMKVRKQLEQHVSHLTTNTEFSKSEMKTLAYIALKQPVKQSMLVKFRSNQAYEDLKALMERGLVTKEPDGRTFMVRTTKKFVQYFGDNPLLMKPNPKMAPINPIAGTGNPMLE